jgi:hypothetical protein
VICTDDLLGMAQAGWASQFDKLERPLSADPPVS